MNYFRSAIDLKQTRHMASDVKTLTLTEVLNLQQCQFAGSNSIMKHCLGPKERMFSIALMQYFSTR